MNKDPLLGTLTIPLTLHNSQGGKIKSAIYMLDVMMLFVSVTVVTLPHNLRYVVNCFYLTCSACMQTETDITMCNFMTPALKRLVLAAVVSALQRVEISRTSVSVCFLLLLTQRGASTEYFS